LHKKQLIALIYGWVVLLVLLFLASVIIAGFLKFTTFNEPLLSWITLAVGVISLFVGGFVAGFKGEMKGWVIGLSVGISFTIFTLLIQYVSYATLFSIEQTLYHLLYIFSAMFGGIIGVNRISA